MTRALKRLLVAASLLLGVTFAFAQPTFTITNVKNACAGLNNGSFDVNVLTANGPVNITLFGPPNQSRPTTAGATESFVGLRPLTWFIIVQDDDGTNFASQAITNVPVNISFSSAPVAVNNSSCSAPNGSITISPTGGNGGPYNYSWIGPNGFTASTQNLSGRVAGNYTVTVSDPTANCSFVSSPITLTDPSPLTQTVSTTSPESVCQGDPATISLTTSQVLNLPLSYYEILKNNTPTGVRVSGTGGPLTLTLPAGSFVNGDVLSVLAVDDQCVPTLMNGTVTLNVHTPPTSATLAGTPSICIGQSTNISVTIVGGTPPYSFTITNYGPVTNYNSGDLLLVTPPATTTYTLSGLVTDANGCSVTGTGNAIVTVNPLPTGTVSATPAAICAGQGTSTLTFSFIGVGPTFNVTYNDGASTFNLAGVPSGHTVVVAPLVTTTYTITNIVDVSTTCANVSTSNTIVNVSIPPTSATLSVLGANPICAGQSTTLKVDIVGGLGPYDFILPGAPPQVGYVSGAAITVTPAVGTTVFDLTGVIVTDSKGCTVAGTGSVPIVVNPLPTAVLSALPAAICAGQGSSTLTFTMTGTPPFDVQYSTGAGTASFSTASLTHTVSVTPGSTTNYSITSISDATTCAGLPGSNVTVTVNTPPTSATLTLTGSNPICAGQSTSLQVVVVGGAGPFDFTITGLGPQVGYVSGTLISVLPALSTTYALTGLVTDASGCTVTGTGSVPVIVNPLPTAVISGGGTVCAGAPLPNVTFTFTGTPPFNFTYSDGTTSTPVANHPSTTFTLVNATAGLYSILSLNDNNTCVGTDFGTPVAVVVNPLPTGDISGTSALCSGGNTLLTFTLPVGTFDVVYTDGTSNFSLPGIVSGATASVSPSASTTYTIVSVTNTATTCSVTAPSPNITGSALVTINSLPTVVISGGGPVCTGAPLPDVTFTFTGTPPFAFTWNDGTTATPVAGYPSTVFTVSLAPVGTYSIISLSDNNGCNATSLGTPVNVSVNPLPTGSIAGTATICAGITTPLTFTLPAGTYDVVYTDGTTNVTLSAIINGATTNVTPAITTSYAIVSITNTTTLCAVTAPNPGITGSADVTVNPAPTATITGGGPVCFGAPLPDVTFTFTGTTPFSFNYTDGTTNFPVAGHPSTSFTITNAPAGTYSITTLTDNTACPGTSLGTPVAVTVNALPTAVVSGGGAVCAGSANPDVTFTFTGTAPFDFSYSDGTTVTPVTGHPTTTFTITAAAVGSYSITSLTDSNGCIATSLGAVVAVSVNPLPVATLSGGGTVCVSDPLPNVDFAFTGTAPFNFSYSDGTTTTPVVAHPSATFTIPNAPAGTYSIVNLTDNNSCTATNLGTPVPVVVSPLPTGVLSGSASICVGSSANLTLTLTGTPPWDIVYSDGASSFPVTAIGASPFTIVVSPLISTNYSLVSVTDAICGTGTGSGTPSITVNPIAGNPATFGIDTWLGYVYDDAGDPAAYPAKVNFSNAKYRGVIDETDIAATSPASSYTTTTDEFDLNISNNPSGFTVHSANVCGTYNDNFSVRYRMRKTFAQGIYTFTIGSDDGVRLFLDGVSIIPGAFVNQSYTTYTSAAQCVSAGPHDLVIEYFENTGFSRLTFNYQSAPAPTVTPATACVNTPAPTLSASSIDPAVTGFNWYKDAAKTTLLFSGANFTPLAADLDMTVAGTTSFFATAVYACGESVTAQADVDVVNTAVITPPSAPTQICQTAGIIDLNTLVSAIPPGGTFTFSGIGVSGSPNFDPTLVAGTTTITADYASGSCTASINFNIDVVSVAAITVPASPIPTCQTSGLVDMTTLVSATPAGGTFTFIGAGVTGNNFDPSAQSGPVVITVDYNAGGCTDSKTLTFDVSATATLTTSNTTVCPGAGTVDLTTLVSALPAGGIFTFSGPSVAGNIFDPSTHVGSIVTINVDYDQGGCTASGSFTVAVRNFADPLCGGGGINCSVYNVTITDVRPSCSNQNDGVININVSGGTPNYVVTLTDGASFNQALPGPGPLFSFTNLSPANYTYTIQDGGGNICTLPHSLPIHNTIQATASNFVDATCFNQAVGIATVTVNSGGAAPFEYSLDGGLNWIVFTSPVTINNLLPSPTPYAILVRDDATDVCPAQVTVTINNAVADIVAPSSVTHATCANNDGSIQIGTVTGGTPPYSFVMDGVSFAALPAGGTFSSLSGGVHLFTVVDASGCSKDFPIVVNFPGLVNFTTAAIDPDCSGNGANGQLTVTITSVGTFQVGITTDPLVPPTAFQNVISAGSSTATFNNLSKGTYYVSAQSSSAQCPTLTSATLSSGPVVVDFSLTPAAILCFESTGGVTLQSIVGAPSIDYQYQILNLGTVVQSGTITTLQAVTNVPLTGLAKGDYQIQLKQDQSAATGCASPIASAFKSFTVNGPTGSLDTLSVARTISLPDLSTGSMLIGIKESGQEPYEVKLDLTQPIFPSQFYHLDWTEAARNPQSLVVEYKATNLYAGQYTLSIRDALGCEKQYSVTLNVDTDVFIPNIFTPNGDGVNDVFFIRNLPSATDVIITNRWGKEVYRSGDYQNDWSGGNSDDGVYYYRIRAGGQTFNGWLEIQRGLGQP